MRRLEIFANQSIRRDILDAMESAFPDFFYTLLPSAYGNGFAKPKKGTPTWPEENFVLIVYDTEERVCGMKTILERIRVQYPREGIAFFVMGESS